jgi:hypothetical protein
METTEHQIAQETSDVIVDPARVAYIEHPTTRAKHDVITVRQTMCKTPGCDSNHNVDVYMLKGNSTAYYCEYYEGVGKWVWSSK